MDGPDSTVEGGDIGCADGQRGGPPRPERLAEVAGCSGAWEVPGIPRSEMMATCERGAGDDALANQRGQLR